MNVSLRPEQERLERHQAIERLRTFGQREGVTLGEGITVKVGEGITVKDLITEGKR